MLLSKSNSNFLSRTTLVSAEIHPNKCNHRCPKKKEKEVLLHNLKNIVGIIKQRFDTSINKLTEAREEYRGVQMQYDQCILSEKEHFSRIREFEEECEKNDKLREIIEASGK